MTEEQKKKCKEIIDFELFVKAYNKSSVGSIIITMTISLAKVFNKEITEEEAKEISKNISKANTISSNPHTNSCAAILGIANYLDDGTTDGMIPNYFRDKHINI